VAAVTTYYRATVRDTPFLAAPPNANRLAIFITDSGDPAGPVDAETSL
jgi:hypothetical protein